MDWIETALEDPEQLATLGYTAAMTATAAYAAHRNDFGASGKTDVELEEYLEEAETGPTHPIQTWKAYEFRKEQNSRENFDTGEKQIEVDPDYEEMAYEERSSVSHPISADD